MWVFLKDTGGFGLNFGTTSLNNCEKCVEPEEGLWNGLFVVETLTVGQGVRVLPWWPML